MSRIRTPLPKVVEKEADEIDSILSALESTDLAPDIKRFLRQCVEVAIWLPNFLQEKNISINRLRTIIFGKGYQKNKKPRKGASNDETSDAQAPSDMAVDQLNTPSKTTADKLAETASKQDKKSRPKKPGHGRIPHTAYENAEEITLSVDAMPGDYCPSTCGGKLRKFKPGIFIRIKGQNFARVQRYTLEKLRCDLCGMIIRATLPPEVGEEKYDARFNAMLALLKYYVAIPFYRQEFFQKLLKFPLPDATQWYQIQKLVGRGCYAVFNHLKILAANGKLIHTDDTRLVILEVIKLIKAGLAGTRTGMYTSGFIVKYASHQIALFINGRQHAGENLADLLAHRKKEEPIIQMSDALSANIPKAIQTILCNCLSHGFRKFNELVNYFPNECLIVMKKISDVYDNDEKTRQMSDEERLLFHQKQSQLTMDELKQYMDTLISSHQVEPNSQLGKAIKYMQNHWEKLTRFLTVAGAPLDNNVLERSLKIAIRNRKSAMFYRTEYSAYIGGVITSLIYTCCLAKENPLDYLTALQIHHEVVTKTPGDWLPWNYRQTMANCANPKAHSPPQENLVAV